jgi:hypothetical protein
MDDGDRSGGSSWSHRALLVFVGVVSGGVREESECVVPAWANPVMDGRCVGRRRDRQTILHHYWCMHQKKNNLAARP